jgi:GNAT superfamily N-acetyltransferase
MERDLVSDTSHTAPIIRYATERDASAIAWLYQYTTCVAYRGYVPDAVLDTRSVDDLTQLWAARISQPPSKERRILVADPSQVPSSPVDSTGSAAISGFIALGAATSLPEKDEKPVPGEIHYIFVAPEEWHSGLGRLLMQCAIGLLRNDGYHQAILWVFSENKRARRFYEAAGWQYDELERPDPAFAAFHNPPLEMRYRISL